MAIDIATTITGEVLTGLTSPTYVLTSDNPPMLNARQAIVSSLGGTQTGVRTHAPSDPFTYTIIKPLKQLALPKAHPVTGMIPGNVGRNKYILKVRKGLVPLVGQNPQVGEADVVFYIPSGAETNDTINCTALISALIGLLKREGPNILTMVKTGSA